MSSHNKHFIISVVVTLSMIILSSFLFPIMSNYLGLFNNVYYMSFMDIVSGIAFTGLFVLITVEIVSLFIDKNSSIFTVLVSIFIFICLSFSNDFMIFISGFDFVVINGNLSHLFFYFSNLAATLASLFIFLHVDESNPSNIKTSVKVYAIVGVIVSSALSLFASGVFIQISLLISLFFIHTVRISYKHRLTLYWLFESFIFFLLIGIMIHNSLSFYFSQDFYTYNLTGFYSVFIIGLFIAVYTNYVVQQSISLKSKEGMELRLKDLQNSVLKNQISPHFLFNALANIKGTYAVDTDKGNTSIDILSSYLRTYLSSENKYIVPFDQEMEVIENYLSIINLKFNTPFNVIYDIDVSDFDIVFFGLQPFVENAIKYSGIKEKEDGQIVISTRENESDYTVTISDNGIGFDPHNISDNSYGIINTVERFKLLQNATIKIFSAPGEGCSITIRIPKKD